ncbi:MAG: hypothetical protein RI885_1842 [Actinomycetota bacterium]|jgi:hypothetical protein
MAQQTNKIAHQQTRDGLSDAEYATMIDVLRRVVGNLGGDPTLR